MKSKVIAISAIASSFIAIFLTLGAYIELIDVFVIIISSCFLVLPIYLKSYKGAFLSYLCGGVLGIIFAQFNVLNIVFFSYFLFFGIFPIILEICLNKKISKLFTFFIGLIWFIVFSFSLYFFYTSVLNLKIEDMPLFIEENIYLFILIFSFVFYCIYQRFLICYSLYIKRLLKRVIK